MHSENNCDIEEKKCNTSQKYKKEDIILLAQNCGVDILNEKGKTKSRKELCRDIANRHLETSQNLVPAITQPVDILVEEIVKPIDIVVEEEISESGGIKPRFTENELKSKKVPELKEIAGTLGVKKNQNKPQLIQAILDKIDADFPVNIEPAVTQMLPPIITTPEPKYVSKRYTEKELKSKKVPELKEIAGTLGVKKNQNKSNLIQSILDKIEEDEVSVDIVVDEEPLSVFTRPLSPRPSSPRPSSPRPLSPRPVIQPDLDINIPTITDLIKKKRDELETLLKIKKQQECNPLKGLKCDDNKFCNIDKNVCISSEEAMYKQNKGIAEISTFNDQNIIGSKSALNLLNTIKDDDIFSGGVEETKEQPVEIPVVVNDKPVSKKKRRKNTKILCDVCTFVNDPGSEKCAICGTNLLELEDKLFTLVDENIEIDNIDETLGEGTEITNIENIQNILNEIQTKEDISLNGMDTAKRKVLSCLGLLG